MAIDLTVNGTSRSVSSSGEVPLLYALRDELGLTGAKYGCGSGHCGSCTVLLDGLAVRSCVVPLEAVGGREVTTLEGLRGDDGGPHALHEAFLAEQAGQCAYCISGMIMTAASLLGENPAPEDRDIRLALDGNLCRCGSHNRILRAVRRAAAELAT
jgi:nicotinate dehydrogenase subunit A